MIPKSKLKNQKLPPLLAFGPHPDDVEFAAGAIIAKEARAGRPCHLVVCSRGESATNGTPSQRTAESRAAAKALGATIEFLELDGDAHLQIKLAHALKIAALIRRLKPAILLAPTLSENQHPDHFRLARIIRDAARLARYAGIRELKRLPPHSIDALFFYAITPDAEGGGPRDIQPILIDISDPAILNAWKAAIRAHKSQLKTRDYLDLHLTHAHLHGIRAGVSHALPLFPNDPLLVDSLAQLTRSSRHF